MTPSNWSLPHIYLSHLLSPLFFIYYIYYPTTPFVMRISGPGDCPGHLLFPSVCVYCCTIYSRLAGLNPPCRFTSDVYPWRLFHFISHIYIFLFNLFSLLGLLAASGLSPQQRVNKKPSSPMSPSPTRIDFDFFFSFEDGRNDACRLLLCVREFSWRKRRRGPVDQT